MFKDVVVETFLELHEDEHKTIKKPEICPVCEILARETKDVFEDELSVAILDVVTDVMDRWNRRQYFIANNSTPEILASSLVSKILDYPITPKMMDIPLEASEIWNHPYVLEKIKELSK